MFYSINRIYKSIGTQYDAHRKKMILSCLTADSVVVPEHPKGHVKSLCLTVDKIISDLPQLSDAKDVEKFLYELVEQIGGHKRKGEFPFVNHSGSKSPKGDDVDWFLNEWLKRVDVAIKENTNELLWYVLLDLEVISVANIMNSTIAQIIWSAIRCQCDKAPAYIPIGEISIYRSEIKTRRSDQEVHFNFKQKIKS